MLDGHVDIAVGANDYVVLSKLYFEPSVRFHFGGKLILRDCRVQGGVGQASESNLLNIETETPASTTIVTNCRFTSGRVGVRVAPTSGSRHRFLDDVTIDQTSVTASCDRPAQPSL